MAITRFLQGSSATIAGMRRGFGIVLATITVAAGVLAGTGTAAGATLCVGGGGGCYHTIQAALDASHAGDRIVIGRGTFAGGVQVRKSVQLVGMGSGRTVIRGGRSVVTIGRFGASHEPTVAIFGVTVTGGVAHSSPESIPFTGKPNVFAAGAGIEIPPNADFSGGATVTIANSVIAGNRVAPLATATFDSGPACPGGPCPFAGGFGAGIDSWGTLTLTRSVVRGNTVGGVASDADGGGIASHLATLTLTHSTIQGNRAIATPPNARFAEGGGVYVEGGGVHLDHVTVTRNAVRMTTDLPAFAGGGLIDMNANSGGVHIADGPQTVVVEHSVISRNAIRADGRAAEPCAFDSGMLVGDRQLVMRDTVISQNRGVDVAKTFADIGPCGSAFDTDGGTATLSHIRVTGNTSTSRSSHGAALVAGAFSVLGSSNHAFRQVTLSDSVVADNVAIARSTTGSAVARGAGVFSNGLLELLRVSVVGNTAIAVAPTGFEQGGGIWSGPLITGPPVRLDLLDSLVAGNVLLRRHGIVRHGGGLFTNAPHRISNTKFRGNVPGSCFGC